MYLTKETSIWGDERKKLKISGIKGIKTERVETIIEEIGDLRKVNSIHKWFVDNIQNGIDDCNKYYVSEENLTKLLKLIKKVLKNENLAKKLLPTTEGFFFGQTEYDKWYFIGLKETKEILEKAIKEKNGSIYYQSSW